MNDLWPEADPELATRRLYKALTHQEIATNPDVEAGTIRAGALVTGLNQARSSGVDDAPLLAELRRLARSGACTSEANLHMALGLHHRESDPVASQRGFERAVEIADQHRLIFTAIAARCGLASVLLDRGINEGSLRSLREALEWVQGQGFWIGASTPLTLTSHVLEQHGNPALAISLFAAAGSENFRNVPIGAREARIAQLDEKYPDIAAGAWADGDHMTTRDAVATALAEITTLSEIVANSEA